MSITDKQMLSKIYLLQGAQAIVKLQVHGLIPKNIDIVNLTLDKFIAIFENYPKQKIQEIIVVLPQL